MNRTARSLIILSVPVAAAIAAVILTADAHTILVIIGGTPGTVNLLWGGFLSCLSEFTIIGGLVAIYKKHTCHEPRCWRLGHHPVAGTPYVACRKHHPGLPDKAAPGDIARAYEKAGSHT